MRFERQQWRENVEEEGGIILDPASNAEFFTENGIQANLTVCLVYSRPKFTQWISLQHSIWE
ncbi:hypothetical protein BH23BAC3_BH23BAC3_27160 [soil metagenome]